MKVDDFDRSNEPATDAEIAEVRAFAERWYPELARELDRLEALPDGFQKFPELIRLLVDDMRRVQAGKPPRYAPYRYADPRGV